MEGWLQKRGGKGHTFKNWKKRWFTLRGSSLSYFSDLPVRWDFAFACAIRYLLRFWITQKEADDVDNMCGSVDLASVSQFIYAESLADTECEKPNYFKIVINNQREYYVAANTKDEKDQWVAAINKNSKVLSRQFNVRNRTGRCIAVDF